MKLPVYNAEGKKIDTLETAKGWKDVIFAKQAVKDTVIYALANKRRGTAKAKDRSELNFTTRKPWAQKGTGRARSGTASSPIWRKGGVVFGPKPRDFAINLPKKVRRLALQSVLGEKVRNSEIIIIDRFNVEKPKTKTAKIFLDKIECNVKPLIVMKENNKNVQLSVRNIPGVGFIRVNDLNVYDVLSHKKMVIDKDAWEILESKMLDSEK